MRYRFVKSFYIFIILICFPIIAAHNVPAMGNSSETAQNTAFHEPSGVLTLTNALGLAIINNPELATFSWELRASEARKLQAGLISNPELEVEVEGIGERSAQAPLTPADTLKISQLIESGGKRSKRVEVASLERDLTNWDYEAKRLDVITQTAKSFIEVQAAQETAELNKELTTLAEKIFKTVSERVAAGEVSPLEEVRAKANLAAVKIEAEKQSRNLEASRRRLSACWGGTDPEFEKVTGNFELMAEIPSSEKVLSQNPDIARWNTEIAKRKAEIKLEEANKMPDFTVSVGIQSIRGYDNEYNDLAYMVGFSIPLPLFNRNQGGVEQAENNLTKSMEERRTREIKIKTELDEARLNLYSAHAWADSLKNEILPAAQRVFDASNEGYRRGKFSYLDVLDAQRNFFQARGQYIEALSAYHQAVVDVERLTGKINQKGNTNDKKL